MKVLIVEDEIIAAAYLKQIVTNAQYNVVGTVGTGKGAIELAKSKKPDLILMDIMLKDNISGVDAAIEINFINPNIMIVFLTAYTEASMIEMAKDANTVGYFLKPYNKEEIVANLHIFASKKQEKHIQDTHVLNLCEKYTYDFTSQRLYCDQQEIILTQKELELIKYLCENKLLVLHCEDIIIKLWGDDTPHQTLRSLIYRIRKKTCQNFIVSVSKRGYRISLRKH